MKKIINRLKEKKIGFMISIFLTLLIVISLGSAILSSTLNIGGKAKIKENSWVIYFDDIRDVSASQHFDERATIVDLAKTRIEFDAKLEQPGDYYEFYVDTVNDGTIDAAIDSIEMFEFTEEQKKYLELRVIDTSTGLDLKRCDTLLAGERKEVKVIVKFKDGLPLEDYPKEAQSLSLFFTIHYAQHPIDGCDTTPKPKTYKLYVIPNGGIYEKRTTPTRIPLKESDEYTTTIPTRKLYNFDGWEVVKPNNDGGYDTVELTGEEDFEFNPVNENTKGAYLFKMGTHDVYIRAKWIENDYVARIEDTYYTTIQAAFDSVDGNNPKTGRKWTDNTVWLLRDTTEYPTNNAIDSFTFNLDGHTVTGSITNPTTGVITMVNGKVVTQQIEDFDTKINNSTYTFTDLEKKDLYAFKNYGTVNVGVDEGLVDVENSIAFIGNQAGLYNYENIQDETKSATFNFYDGYLEGLSGLVGEYDDTPENYYVFSEYRSDTNMTRVYLVRNPSRAVAKTYSNNVMYHYNLQSAIDALTTHQRTYGTAREKDYKMDAIRNFEAAYELSVGPSTKIVFDLVGYTVQTGEKVTNEGNLKIVNSKTNLSVLKASQSIENKNKLEIENVDFEGTKDEDVIINSGDLKLSKITVSAKNSYGIKNISNGTITFDKDTILKSEDKCGLYNSGNNLVVNSGKIYCFENTGTATSTGNPEYYLFKTKTQPNSSSIKYMPAIKNSGTINFDNGSVTSNTDTNMIENSGTFNFNDGLMHSDYLTISNSGTFNVKGSEVSSLRTPIKGGTVNVEGGDVKSETTYAIENANVNVKSGNVYTLDGIAMTGNKTYNISGGTVRGTTYAIRYRNNDYSATVNVTGGLVEAPVAIDVKNINIKGGIVKGTDPAILTDNYTMTGGKVISTEGIGVIISNKGTITGGEVYGSTYGVLSQNELTLGEDEEEISSTSPMLLGELYGLYITGSTTNFFDGILKGEVDGYYGPITGTPLGGVVFEGDEYILKDENGEYIHSEEGTLGAEFYNTDFISSIDPWLRIGDTTYNTLNAASLAILDGNEETIYVTRDVDILFAQKILDENNNKHITLDLNGHKVSTTQMITNYSNLTITDSSKGESPEDDAGSESELKFIKNVGFNNEYELTIDGGNYRSTTTGLFVNNKNMTIKDGVFNSTGNVVDNNSKLIIDGGRIESSTNAIDSSKATVIMNDGYIYSSNIGILNGTFTMNGGEIYAKNNGTSGGSDAGTVTLNNGKITAENGYAVQRTWYNNVKIYDGEYTSLNNIAIKCHYNIYIYGGTIKGTIGVEDGGFSNGINEWIYGDTYVDGANVKIYGTTDYGVNVLYGTLYDYEGYIQGETDGVYTNTATIQLGKNDGSISTEKPVVLGKRYGIHNNKGTFRFYDGIIKGKAATSESNDGHHGIITLIPDGTMVKDDDFEFIDRVEYDVEYLTRIGDWLELSDGSRYNSINAAYEAAKPTDTMTVIRNVHVAFEQTMPSGKNITFNTNGKSVTLTQTINVRCNSTFMDSEGTGSLHNVRTNTISNSGVMTINSGNYTTDKGNALYNSGTIYMNGGYYSSEDTYPIISSGNIVFEDGEIYSSSTYAVRNTGTFTMNHGEIKNYEGISNGGTLNVKNDSRIEGLNGYSIAVGNNGTTNISDEAVIYNEYTNAISASCGQVNIEGGTIESTVNDAISLSYTYSCGTGKLTMTAGDVIGFKNGIVQKDNTNRITMSGGHVIGKENNGITSIGTTNINGGVVEGNVYGLYVNGGTTTIGEDDNNISIAEPVLKGELYGLYISNPQNMTVNFYDGILKGQNWGHYNDVTNIPDRSNIIYGYETIESVDYNTAYLYKEGDIAINTRTQKIYNNLQDALDEALDNDTVELINDVPLFYQVINNNNLILDMKGHTISTNKNITNRGNLKIVNTSDKEAVIQTSINTNLITNTNKLEVDNVTLRNVSASYYVINSTGEVKLNNAKIDSIYGVSSSDKLDIINSNIKATQTAINNTGVLNITKGVYSGGSYSVYSNSRGNVTINGTYILDNQNGIIYSSDTEFNGTFYNTGNNTTTIDGVVIVGNLQNSTKLNMSNTKVTGSYTNSSQANINKCIIQRGHTNSGTGIVNESIITGNLGDKVSNSGTITINDSNIILSSSERDCSYYTCYPYNAITNSGTMTYNRSVLDIDRDRSLRYEVRGIYNTGTLNIQDNTTLNVGLDTRTSGTYMGIMSEGNGHATITDSTININGGNISHAIYTNSANSLVTLETGTLNVLEGSTTYGAYINLGTFTMGHEEGTGIESELVSTENPRIDSYAKSKGIGVKKINGSFNFYDGVLWASKFTKPETTTNVELNYEVTTYVDETNGYEYALLEYMQNDYQGTTVAKIGETHYRTVQDAINKVEPGEVIILLRSTSEELVVPADRIANIDLNNHSITTHLVNNGSLQIYNGSLQNFDVTTIENNGTLIMGQDDSNVSSTNVRIISEVIPVINNGTFKMYDGYLEGNPSLEGSVNEIAQYARLHTKKDSQSEKKYLQSLSPEAIMAGETDLILTIDPYGGYYEDSKEIKTTYLKYQQEYDLSIPTKRACVFTGWVSSDPNALNNEGNKVTIGVTDITVTATWEVSENAVAKVGNEYFESLQEALDYAEDNLVVELLKDTTENINNRSNITLDLGGHKITGTFVNNGVLKLLNGEIENPNGTGLVNNKALTLGENDGELNEDSIRIIGTGVGLEQNGRFNFYDGFIEGEIALIGKTDSVPKGYFLYNERDTIRNLQKVYLIGNPANAVAVIEEGGTQYFFSLQDAINTAHVTGSEIFIVRDFEASYPVEIPTGADILINMNSYNITTGNNIINNGTLKIYDTSENYGSISSSRVITNNGNLTIEDVNIKQNTSSNNTIDNASNASLTIKNCMIEAKNGYAVNNNGNLILDGNYTLKGDLYALYSNGNELTLNGGTIYGIETKNNITIEDGVHLIGNTDAAGILASSSVDVVMNGGIITSTSGSGIKNTASNVNVTMNGGSISSKTGLYCNQGTANYVVNDGTIVTDGSHPIYMYQSNCNLEVNGGDISSTTNSAIYFYNSPHIVKITGGSISTTSGYAINYDYSSSNSSNIVITGGKLTGASHGVYLNGSKLNMTGGEITTTSTDRSNYAIYMYDYTGLTLSDNAFVNSPHASGIYGYTNITINGGHVLAGASNAYGLYGKNANVTINGGLIETTGENSYGIFSSNTNSQFVLTMNDGEIKSNNIGIYYNNSYDVTRTVNIYGGKVFGNNYGIYQINNYTTNIGKSDNELSTNIPFITGGLYGIYKTDGTLNFYNGRLRGYTDGYTGMIKNIRNGHEITSVSEDNEMIEMITYTTTNVSSEPLTNTAKVGNGYAKITYIGETTDRCENGETFIFDYTGTEETFVPKCAGTYKLEVWGAQGGYGIKDGVKNSGTPGYGAYSTGTIELDINEILYINVGGKGEDGSLIACPQGGYNGGGFGTNDGGGCTNPHDDDASGAGGGATHIATFSGLLKDLENHKSNIIIVAGGGGGASYNYSAGSGGGFKGGVTSTTTNIKATQESGYAFGKGKDGTGTPQGSTCNTTTQSCTGLGGGGGGYYGGLNQDYDESSSGTGGSGYLSNRLTDKYMYGYNVDETNHTWINNFLIEKGAFVQVGDRTFNSLNDAQAYIEENGTGTMILLKDVEINELTTLEANKNITLDLNGYTLTSTRSIDNYSNLTIIDSSQDKTSKMIFPDSIAISSYAGSLTVDGVDIKSSNSVISVKAENNEPITVTNSKLEGVYGIYLNYKQKIIVENSEIVATTYGIHVPVVNADITLNNSDIKSINNSINITSYNAKLNITDTDISSDTGYAINSSYGTNTDSNKSVIDIIGGTIKSRDTHAIYLQGTKLNTDGTTVKTQATNRDIYGVYMDAYSIVNLVNSNIDTPYTSGIRSNGESVELVLDNTKVETNYTSGYGIYARRKNVTLKNNSKIIANGVYSYGIYIPNNSVILNIKDSYIYSKNIAVYTNDTGSNSRQINIESGFITGENYGIYLNNSYTTLTIGNIESEFTSDTPIIKGRLYGLYNNAGTTKFYNGKLVGGIVGNYKDLNEIRTKKNLYTTESMVTNSYNDDLTVSTIYHSETPITSYAKEGSGYARITYKDTPNETCTDNKEYNFEYTGSKQTFIAECAGVYELEVWGAQGGNAKYNDFSNIGGYGGYSKGNITLSEGETLYIYVGGKGQSINYKQSSSQVEYDDSTGYNGGGKAVYSTNNSAHAAGGGATHIATSEGLLKDLENNKESIIIVAGAGGGASTHNSYPSYSGTGGSGGGTIGGSGITINTTCYNFGTGGTQTSPGSYIACSNDGRTSRNSTPPDVAGFGLGGNYTSNNSSRVYSGGGAGYYGGEAGYHAPGGGGSGYIGSERLTNVEMYSYEVETQNSIWNISYLGDRPGFLEVNGVAYNNFEAAADAIETEGTIKLLNDALYSESATLPSGKTITFDLNGHELQMSESLVNESNLTIVDSSQDKTGKIDNLYKDAIVNKGNITINGTYIKSAGVAITGNYGTGNIIVNESTLSGASGIWVTTKQKVNVTSSNIINTSNRAIYSNVSGIDVTVIDSNLSGTSRGIELTNTDSKLVLEDSKINTTSYALYISNYRSNISITNSEINSKNDYSIYSYEGSSDTNNYIIFNIIDSKITSNNTVIYTYGTKINSSNSIIETYADNRDNYGIDMRDYTIINLTNGSIVRADNGSGIRKYSSSSTLNITDSTIEANRSNSYGIYQRYGTTNINSGAVVKTTGSSSYAIYMDYYNSTTNINGGTIDSANIGVNIGSNNNYDRVLNVNSGSIYGSVYGIQSTFSYNTVNIGNRESVISIYAPNITGGLYGIYETAGTLNIYSGRVSGGTGAYTGTFNTIRSGYEIYEESNDISKELQQYRTYTTDTHSDEALSNTPKENDGYAKITYNENYNVESSYKDDEILNCYNLIGAEYIYKYTGNEQEFKPVCNGKYKIELWGAAGGATYNGRYLGGAGAYTSGEINLNTSNKLYVYVGEYYSSYKDAMSYNGGGKGSLGTNETQNGNGGGATDVRLVNGSWDNFDSLKSRIMVAAGGGGSTRYGSGATGGYGGTLIGGSGNNYSYAGGAAITKAGGGTQTSGGLYASANPQPSGTTLDGQFGIGGYAEVYSDRYRYHAGGGGGYYGGGAGGSVSSNVGSGAGGSSYISGYVGCDSISEDSTEDNIIHTGLPVHYSNMSFSNAIMIAGNSNMPTKDGSSTMVGNTGAGYAKITLLELDEDIEVEFISEHGTLNNNKKNYKIGDKIGTLEIPTITDSNFIFDGWYTEPSYVNRIDENYEVLGSMQVFAKYKKKDSICSIEDGTSYTFSYSGNEEVFTPICDGIYTLEVWGAAGGGPYGGYGGYSKGDIVLNTSDRLYINVGGRGLQYDGGYNGGGTGGVSGTSWGYGGGGATHIALKSGLLSSLSTSRDSILIVAAGGGGGSGTSNNGIGYGGAGGGYIGNDGLDGYNNSYTRYNGIGASQTNGGYYYSNSAYGIGSFGTGGNTYSYGAGGGAGYYGGGGSRYGYTGAGGGSGYIGNQLLSNKYMYGYNVKTRDNIEVINTIYLVREQQIVYNQTKDEYYSNLQTALTDSNTDDVIKLLKNANISYTLTVDNNKKLTLDLNGYNLVTSKNITNNGNLRITNLKDNTQSKLSTKLSITLINNNGVLNVDNLSLSGYIIINNGTNGILELNGTTISSNNQAIVNTGEFSINDSNITGTNYAIYNNTTKNNIVTDSVLSSSNTAIYKNNTSTTTITNTPITGNVTNNSSGILSITGQSLDGYVTNNGTYNMNGVTMNKTVSTGNSVQLISNSGTMTLENNNLTITNTYAFDSTSLYIRTVYNTGTLTSRGNTYISRFIDSNNTSKRYENIRSIDNTGLLTSTNDNYEGRGGYYCYAIYNNSSSDSKVYNMTANIHDCYDARISYNNGDKTDAQITFDGVNGNVHHSTIGRGFYIPTGTMTIKSANVNIHDNTTSYGNSITGGTLTIESGTFDVSGTEAYGVNMTSGTLNLGIYDGRGTDASDVSINDPYIKAVGSTSGIGVSAGDGDFNYYDGYITGSTNARAVGDTTTSVEKNYQVVTKIDDETGYEYCILEFIH